MIVHIFFSAMYAILFRVFLSCSLAVYQQLANYAGSSLEDILFLIICYRLFKESIRIQGILSPPTPLDTGLVYSIFSRLRSATSDCKTNSDL